MSETPDATAGHDHQGATPAATRVAASRRVAAYLLLLAVLGCVAAMSFSGLYGWARGTLGWSPGHAALVPIALDIAAMVCALLALDSIAKGEAASTLRALTAAFVALSAFINWRHAITTGNIAEQVFFPAMSVLAYALVHAVFGKYRREVRRDLAGRPHREVLEELPRLGAAAWARYPRRTFGVASAAIAARLERAEGAVRPSHDATPAAVAAVVPASERATVTPTRPAAVRREAGGEVAAMRQADAIRAAIAEVGEQPREVVAWLAERGRPGIPATRVHDVIRRDRAARGPKLAAV
jgi:Protein of unknown function (DUF2637)